MLKKTLTIGAAIILAACATPYTTTMQHEGRTVIANIDYTDNPCETRGPFAGCSKMIDGTQHIWVSGVADTELVRHELDHDSMAHAEWRQHRYFGNCAEVTSNSAKYPKGSLICRNAGRRERIVPPGYSE